MNILDFSPQSLLMKVIAWLAVIGLVVGALVMTANHFEKVGYDRRVAEDQVNLNKELIEARAKTAELQDKLNKAQDELLKAKNDLDIIARRNGDLLNSLHNSVNSYNGSLSSASREALIARTVALSQVFNECASTLTEVARSADTLAIEVKEMQDAWVQ